MDEKFTLFLNDIPVSQQGFVLDIDKYLREKEYKCDIKSSKSGFVTSYLSPETKKSVLNYVFRKTGVKMRIYAAKIAKYEKLLDELPKSMKDETLKAGNCKKLNGEGCCPSCPAGYTFTMDGEEYKKCRNSAFFYNLNEESSKYIQKFIESEVEN